MFAKSAALLAALSLAASPALAQASAQPLSIQPALEPSAAHIVVDKRLYSVPWKHIGQSVWSCVSAQWIVRSLVKQTSRSTYRQASG